MLAVVECRRIWKYRAGFQDLQRCAIPREDLDGRGVASPGAWLTNDKLIEDRRNE